MNKNDLIAAVAEKCGMSKAEVGKAVDATLETITQALKKNDDVRLVGFGTLSVAGRAASQGRNPRIGQPIKIPGARVARFKAASELRRAVSGGVSDPVDEFRRMRLPGPMLIPPD